MGPNRPPTGITAAPFGDEDAPSSSDLRDLREAIADRLLGFIAPGSLALSLMVLLGELIGGDSMYQLLPATLFTGVFGFLAFFPSKGRPLVRTGFIIATVALSATYLGWTLGSFRAPAVIGLAAILITWTCLFTPRRVALGALIALLASSAACLVLIRTGSIAEKQDVPPHLSLLALMGIYGGLFISVLAPVQILFESVGASRKAEKTAKQALADLLDSRNFTIQAVDNSLHLFGWLSPDGHLRFANATALKVIQARLDEVLGLPFWETPWFSHDTEVQRTLREAIERAARGETLRFDTTHSTPSGRLREIDFSIHPTMGADGNIAMLVVEGRDTTEEKEAVRQREILSERLHQSQKMEAIGQLAGGVAHDFNNSLATISGLTQLLRGGERDPSEHSKFLDMILNATTNAAQLVRKLLRFSRKQRLSVRLVEVGPILEDVASILRSTQDKRVAVSVEIESCAGLVNGDESMLQSAFLNLGINAFHAMSAGGALRFRLREASLSPDQVALLDPPIPHGECIEIEIQDTGCGMAPEVIERIFEPFFTTKEPGKGTGLGMSMVHDTLKELGGSISVESEVGRGTTFRVYMPKAKND